MMKIAVFGSAVGPGDIVKNNAYVVGKAIAESGSVLTNGATQTLGLSAISKLNNGGTLSNDEVINELRLLRKQQAASDRQLPLLVALSVRDAMQLQR